ncbi:MAG: type II secretion system protein GspG [Myxococcota bacterium]
MVKDIPKDPWGEPYRYRRVGKNDFEIRSAGADSEFETEDDIVHP